jgi:hypothetical protein
MAALVVGGKLDGLYGLSYGMLAVGVVQSLITTPKVLRAAFGSVPVRAAAEPVASDMAPQRPAVLADELRVQQEAGLAVLFALATRVAPSPPPPDTSTDMLRPARPPSVPPQWAAADWDHGTDQRRNHHRPRRSTAVSVTRANPVTGHAGWWPDVDEATFRARQETGMAALIAIATHAARF